MADDEGESGETPPDQNQSVGYGRPPRHTQFKKGRSGNPKGRPKGSFNISTLIEKELNAPVVINENGVRKRISKKQAIAKQIVNKAASGDYKAVPLLMNEERFRETNVANAPAAQVRISDEDQLVMESLLRRIRESKPAQNEGAPPQQPSDQPAPPAQDEGKGP